MSASTSGANVSPAVLLPCRATFFLCLASVVRLFQRPDALDDLRHMADAQLRDIGLSAIGSVRQWRPIGRAGAYGEGVEDRPPRSGSMTIVASVMWRGLVMA
jgi:hypothetical protein